MNTARKCFNTSNFCIQAGKKQDGKHLLPEFFQKVWLLSTTLSASHVFWEQSAISIALSWYLPCCNSASAEKFADLASCSEQSLCQSITVINVAQQNHGHHFLQAFPFLPDSRESQAQSTPLPGEEQCAGSCNSTKDDS